MALLRPVIVYDGDCGFCTRSVRFLERYVRPPGTITAFQERTDEELAALKVSRERAEHEVIWAGPSGRVEGGADAVAAILLSSPFPYWWPVGSAMWLPAVRPTAHAAYRWVADNRMRLPGGTPACALPPAQRPGARPLT
ncbi:MAG: DUF393 domain-containing protein [Streptosporangiales bacterium]|nr:DUF393 domain-containing protein [Streptosporangiales bacterium]